jgi:beta-glucanase (GH16 family)
MFATLLMFCGTVFAQNETLFWSDEFNGTGAPDPKYWSYELGATGYGNNEVQNYTSDLSNSRQEGGILIIEASKKAEEWTSARLISKGKFEFQYGKIVFRAKLPAGSGTWPALWMLGANIDTVGWPDGGEIDVMEHVGRRPTIVQSAMHTRSSYGNTVNVGFIPVEDFDKEFHTYEANWTPEKIEFSVDGKIYYTYNPAVKDKETWPFNKPCYILMNIAMGGNFGSDPQYETNGLKNGIDPKLSSVRMEVDYVRVYKMPEHK